MMALNGSSVNHWQAAQRREPRHLGFTLMEVTVAAGIVAVLLAVVGEMIVLVNVARRTADRQAAAQETADNLLERVANLPWDTIGPDVDLSEVLPAEFIASLPVARWDVTVSEEDVPLTARRIRVTVYRTGGGETAGPIRLTAWVYPPGEEVP